MSNTARNSRSYLLLVFILALTTWITTTAVRIEFLNHQMGGFLPRPDPISPYGGNNSWRTSSQSLMEGGYRIRLLMERGEAPDTLEKIQGLKLNPAEQAELDRLLKRNAQNTKLRGLVYGPGLFQFILIPLCSFLCISLFTRVDKHMPSRIAASLCFGLCLSAGFLALYREYFQAGID